MEKQSSVNTCLVMIVVLFLSEPSKEFRDA